MLLPRLLQAATVLSSSHANSVTSKPFYMPGTYVTVGDDHRMRGGMYVELWQGDVTQPYPIVMIHGGGQTGTCFTAKPDGSEGWAQSFARRGFIVYVIDETARGRSPYGGDLDGPIRSVVSATFVEKFFTASAHYKLWPGAERHCQWPGSGRRGDPIFDRFFASQVPQLSDGDAMERAASAAITSLLREIGPAILLSHSQGGPRGWLVADAVPALVKGILAVEPMGGPFYLSASLTAGQETMRKKAALPFGITSTPITYDPPVDDPTVVLGWESAHNSGRWRLPNLSEVPVAIITGEASYHRNSDIQIAKFLTAMGVKNHLLLLDEIGLCGNGHMMMLERNSDDIAVALMEEISGWNLGAR
jgi:pimeloyl-ACP methyl ester carboxylesterase